MDFLRRRASSSRAAILVSLVCLLDTPVARAQTVATGVLENRAALLDDVHRCLKSAAPSEIAWGAFLAAQYRLHETIPAMSAALQRPASANSAGHYSTIAALLDSLVQLGARVPARQVEGYLSDWPVQTTILLKTASAGRDAVLLRQVKTAVGFPWYVAANTLLESKTDGFAAELLRRVKLRLTIKVSDDGHPGPWSGGPGGEGVGDGIGVNPEGYPPTALYRFEREPRGGHVVLAPGPRAVYYSRAVTTARQYGWSQTYISGPTDDDRIDYLKAMVDPGWSGPLQLRARQQVGVMWKPTETVEQRMSRLRDDVTARYGELISLLLNAKRLTQKEADSLSLDLDVQVVDARFDRSRPLPVFSRRR